MTERPAKRARTELTLDLKVRLIRDSHSTPKLTQKQLGIKYGISRQTVSDILKRQGKYLDNFEENADSSKKRFNNSCKFDDLNKLVWHWFQEACVRNLVVNGPIIQEKSLSFANELGISDFKASNGWLNSWKNRFSIKSFSSCGEIGNNNLRKITSDYKSRLPEICAGYEPCDIFNCDETGMFYRVLPDENLSHQEQTARGRKQMQKHVTVLLCCSAAGEKFKPLVIGENSHLRVFKKDNVDSLPVLWRANKKGQMTCELFEEWLDNVNQAMGEQERNILLFTENTHLHSRGSNLSNVKVKFLPANTMSKLQPLDQGIIRAFKMCYRRLFLSWILSEMETAASMLELCKSISVLDAIWWIDQAWCGITRPTVIRCFQDQGFPTTKMEIKTEEQAAGEDLPALDMLILLVCKNKSSCCLEKYLEFDRRVPTEDISDINWETSLINRYLNSADKDMPDNIAVADGDDNADDTNDIEPCEKKFITKHNLNVTCDHSQITENMNLLVKPKLENRTHDNTVHVGVSETELMDYGNSSKPEPDNKTVVEDYMIVTNDNMIVADKIDTCDSESDPEAELTYSAILKMARSIKYFGTKKDVKYLALAQDLESLTESIIAGKHRLGNK